MSGHRNQPDVPKPQRRLLRFSLRTLLLLTAVIAVWLGIQVNKAYKQQAAVAAIEAAGGWVYYDWQNTRVFPGKGAIVIIPNDEYPRYHWLHEIVGEDFFQSVDVAAIRPHAVNDEMIEILQGLNQLRSVIVVGPPQDKQSVLQDALPGVTVYVET